MATLLLHYSWISGDIFVPRLFIVGPILSQFPIYMTPLCPAQSNADPPSSPDALFFSSYCHFVPCSNLSLLCSCPVVLLIGNLSLFRQRPSGLHRGGHFAFLPVSSSPTFLSPVSSFPAPGSTITSVTPPPAPMPVPWPSSSTRHHLNSRKWERGRARE